MSLIPLWKRLQCILQYTLYVLKYRNISRCKNYTRFTALFSKRLLSWHLLLANKDSENCFAWFTVNERRWAWRRGPVMWMRGSCSTALPTNSSTPSVDRDSTSDSAASPRAQSTAREATSPRVPSLPTVIRITAETKRCSWYECWPGNTPWATVAWLGLPIKHPPTLLICTTPALMTWITPTFLSYLHLIKSTQNMSLSIDHNSVDRLIPNSCYEIKKSEIVFIDLNEYTFS